MSAFLGKPAPQGLINFDPTVPALAVRTWKYYNYGEYEDYPSFRTNSQHIWLTYDIVLDQVSLVNLWDPADESCIGRAYAQFNTTLTGIPEGVISCRLVADDMESQNDGLAIIVDTEDLDLSSYYGQAWQDNALSALDIYGGSAVPYESAVTGYDLMPAGVLTRRFPQSFLFFEANDMSNDTPPDSPTERSVLITGLALEYELAPAGGSSGPARRLQWQRQRR